LAKFLIKGSEFNRRNFLESTIVSAGGLFLGGFPTGLYGQDIRLAEPGSTVLTSYGRVRGLVLNGVNQFWGIPYGSATDGRNRFLPPKPPSPWSGVNDHFQIGKRCFQAPNASPPSPVVAAMNRFEEESEDCLNLNIFTPGTDNKSRPVMVWMHGGGHSAASGNFLIYDGTNLAKKEDVVVVSVTHRLNIFGYMHLADIGGEKWSQSTNVGTQDLVEALRWVKANIEMFGGDPDRVTIFGQSGGGGKTSSLMALPSAQGLFHRCIAQSGSVIRGISADDANEGTERFLAKLGINNNQLDQLQMLSPQQIQEAFYSDPLIRGFSSGPVIDGNFIPAHPWDTSASGFSADVPLMAGSTETENGWVGPPPYELSNEDMLDLFTTRISNNDQVVAQGLIDLYKRKHPGIRNRMLWLIAESDNTRRWNAQHMNLLKTAQGTSPSFLYLFNWYSPVHNNRMGAYHTLEIPFVFYNMDLGASMTGSSQTRYELAHIMSAAWASFARNGNPNHADMPNWPEFNPETYPTMVFGDEVIVRNDPNQEERLALNSLRM
jgi:para-nitrobenzyl esterase